MSGGPIECGAVRFRQPRGPAIERVEVRSPGAGEVRVKLEGCGVCGSNLPVWEGRPWLEYPLEPGAPGHEGWGTVDAVGAEVHDFVPGDRVALLAYNAYAEYDAEPASSVMRLPEDLNGRAFPGEPLFEGVARLGGRPVMAPSGYVRVRDAGGWWLLCASGTEPKLTIRREADDESGLQRLRGAVLEHLRACGQQRGSESPLALPRLR